MSVLSRAWTLAPILALVVGCGGGPAEEPAEEEGDLAPGTTETAPIGGAAGPAERPATGGASGQAVFVTNCATCHGEDGRGNGPAAVGLEPPPADLSDATWTTGDGSLEAIRNTIENGSPGTAMIAWKGTLTEAQIDAVARHVHSMGGGQ